MNEMRRTNPYRESQGFLQDPRRPAGLRAASRLRRVAAIAAILALRPATATATQTYGTDPVARSGAILDTADAHATPFAFEGVTSSVLQDLWRQSVQLGQEQVACIGGQFQDGVFHVNQVAAIRSVATVNGADAAPSLEQCGPPNWSGTVHTHIAQFSGRPYATFSAPDRAVMRAWERKWTEAGLFCVLYTEAEAYCEYGPTVGGDVSYAGQDGRDMTAVVDSESRGPGLQH